MIKVDIYQPFLTHYREAFYRQLAHSEKLHFHIHTGSLPPAHSWLKSADCSNFSGITLVPNIRLPFGQCIWQKGLKLQLSSGRGDVIVIYGGPRMLSNFPLIWKARCRGIAIVWWGHGWSATSKPWRAWIRRFLMRRLADVFLLYTDREVDDFKKMGFPSNRLFATNNTIDQEPIRQAILKWPESRLVEFRKEQGYDEKTSILLFCSQIGKKTELEVALRALATPGLKKAVLVIIGDGPFRSQYERAAVELGVADRVRWLGAMYDEDALAPWFLSARCFVYPGAIGLSLLHAFGYGLPVVTHGEMKHQMPEIAALRDGQNGLLFEHGNSDDLAQKAASLISDTQLHRQMSVNAKHTVETTFTIQGMVKRFEDAVQAASRFGVASI
jgi:glycosyltransferase involved in cell wall biosynthesis